MSGSKQNKIVVSQNGFEDRSQSISDRSIIDNV